MLHLTNSMGGARGARISGAIFDATGSYTFALAIAASMGVLRPGLLWVVGRRHSNPPPAALYRTLA